MIGRFTYITDTVRPHHRLRPKGEILKLVLSDCFKSTCFDIEMQRIARVKHRLNITLPMPL